MLKIANVQQTKASENKTEIIWIKTYWEGASASECLIQTAESSCDRWRDAEEEKTTVVLTTTLQWLYVQILIQVFKMLTSTLRHINVTNRCFRHFLYDIKIQDSFIYAVNEICVS